MLHDDRSGRGISQRCLLRNALGQRILRVGSERALDRLERRCRARRVVRAVAETMDQ